MFYYYNIFCNGEYLGQVKALNEKSACEQYYMKYGSASKYTGLARNSFTAEKVK
jgi:hypothetical protein